MNIEKSPNLSEVEIRYRIKVKASNRVKIKRSQDLYDLLKTIYNENTVEHHEQAVIIMLNRGLQVLGWAKISQGGITHAVVDHRIIFQHALLANATGIVISHNHPSGIVTPSEQDRILTKKIAECGELLEIKLLDHIIYTESGYYSFADESDI